MRRTLGQMTGVLLCAAALAACGAPAEQTGAPAAQPAPTTETMTEPTAEMMDEPTAETMAEPTAEMMDEPTAETMAEPTAEMMDEPTAETMAEPTAEMMDEPTAEATAEPTAKAMVEPTSVPAAEAPAAPAAELPAWQQVEFTDARTGETFTLASFAGKTVYVEPMATWCSNCKQQLTNAQAAKQQLGDDVVFVALSVEADLPSAELAAYAEQNGFDATFAVASPEALQALVDQFGRTITNPPSTPHFVIWPDGSFSELMTGFVEPDSLATMLGAS